jgi:hypothetical protein
VDGRHAVARHGPVVTRPLLPGAILTRAIFAIAVTALVAFPARLALGSLLAGLGWVERVLVALPLEALVVTLISSSLDER